MMPKKPAPDASGYAIRGGNRFSEKACPRESVAKAGVTLKKKLERDDKVITL